MKSEKIYKQKTILKKEEMIPEIIIKEGERRVRIPFFLKKSNFKDL